MISFFILLSIFSFISLVLPWVLWIWIRSLSHDVKELSYRLEQLQPKKKQKTIAEPIHEMSEEVLPLEEQIVEAPRKTKKSKSKESIFKSYNLERNLVQNLPVWIGGIALALAGLFLVKYSIEAGILSVSIRLFLAGIFGIAMIVVGNWVQGRSRFANNIRISQALSGAGIAVLYTSLYAATSLYELLPVLIGFLGMAAVTVMAVVLSLRQGPSIALIGLISGFLTPALVTSSEPNTPFFFLYLYFILASFFLVIRQRNWWYLVIPLLLGTYTWVLLWLALFFAPDDGIWADLFLVAFSITAVMSSKKAMENGSINKQHSLIFNICSLGGALLFMTTIMLKSQFGMMEGGLFLILTAGGIALSYFNERLYGFVPWVSLVLSAFLLLAWKGEDTAILITLLILFAALFSVSGFWLMWKSQKPLRWGLLACVSSLIYYGVAYLKFRNHIGGDVFLPTDPSLWSALAFGLFILSLGCVLKTLNRYTDQEGEKQKLLASFVLTATTFLFVSLFLSLEVDIFRLTLVAQVLVICWLNQYVNIKALRPVAGILAGSFALLLIPDIIHQFLLIFFDGKDFSFFPTVTWSLVNLGLPVVLFVGSTLFLRREKDDKLVGSFEGGAIALITLMTNNLVFYSYLSGYMFNLIDISYLASCIMMNIFFLYGLGCLWVGRVYGRKAVLISGIILFGLGLLKLIFEFLLISNPLWSVTYVGSIPILNYLLLMYGLPMIWLFFASKEMAKVDMEFLIPFTKVCLFVLVFVCVSLNVRQFFQGAYLNGDQASNAEIYTYSVVWILIGLVLLFLGTLKKDKTLRIASFAFVILSVGKVFLYDAAELAGLLRVLSFFGLGISLLALSWFYTRFVFQTNTAKVAKKKQ